MSKQFSLRGWRIQLDRQGFTITAPDRVNHRREVKAEAWLQAADAFVPGSLLLADVSLTPVEVRKMTRTRLVRRRPL